MTELSESSRSDDSLALEAVHRPTGSITASIVNLIRATWNPQPLAVPSIDPTLDEMSTLERITEVLRYQLLSLEYGLSNRGGLREWARVAIVLSMVLAIPAVMVVPLVTLFLTAAVSWSAMLFLTAKYLLYTILTLIASVVVALVAEQGFRAYWKWRSKQRNRN
jgi:hypothetical protein